MEATIKRNATTALLAMLLVYGAAQAAVWVQAGATKDGARSFVDKSSITIAGSSRRALLKMTFPRHTKKDAGKWVDFYLNHATFECSSGRAKSDKVETHFDDGTSFTSPAAPTSGQQWDRVLPGTVLDTVMKFVCSWKPK